MACRVRNKYAAFNWIFVPSFKPTVIERAFELARSGDIQQFDEIPPALIGEGYADVHQQLGGATIRKQLRELCRTVIAKKQNKPES
jgi:hypothetical protein